MAVTITPRKLILTDRLLERITFDKRVVGENKDGTLETIPVTAGSTDWFLRDSKLQGFSVRVTGKGLRFYAERKLAGRPCRYDCGAWPDTALSKARKTAEAALAMMKLGKDPSLERKKAIAEVTQARARTRETMGLIFECDMRTQVESDSRKTQRDRQDVQKWIEDMAIWRTSIHDLDPARLDEMMHLLRHGRGDATALKVWRYLRAAWNRLDSAERPPRDPFADWLKKHKLPQIRRRQTVIHTDDDAGRKWLRAVASMRGLSGARDYPKRVMADYVLLSLCWGARRSEAAGLRVGDVDFDREFVVFRDTKNSRDHYFPLTPGVAAILRQRISDNTAPRGRDVKKASVGKPYYIPEWVFPSPKRGVHLVEPRSALAIGEKASGMRITMHDLRRGFAGEVAADAMVDDDGRIRGDFGLVKVAMNHADVKSDVTQGYIMVKPRLKMLRPIYEAHERRVFEAAGLEGLLPRLKPRLTIRKQGDEYVVTLGKVEYRAPTVAEVRALALEFAV